MKHPMAIFLLSLLPLFKLSYAVTCFDRTGAPMDDVFQPCDKTTPFSACCNFEQPDGGSSDICTSNGLCLRQDDIPGFFYINGCTDSTFSDTSCPNFCSNSSQNVFQSCDDVGTGTWCCRAQGEPDCCSNAVEANIGVLVLSSQTTVTVSTTKTVGATQTLQTGVMTQTVTADSRPTTCAAAKDKSAVIGASAGAAVLGVAFLGSLGALFWRERTRPMPSIAYRGINQTRPISPKDVGPYEAESRNIHELGANDLSRE